MKIDIEWIQDYIDCETCGMSDASGAVIKINDLEAIDMRPCAACYDGDSYQEFQVYEALFIHLGLAIPTGEVKYRKLLEALGHEVNETHTYPDYDDYDE